MRKPQPISVLDMLKIGVGPSSSHTMGPWLAATRFLESLSPDGEIQPLISRIRVELFGSLAKTGKGHGTDIAVMMGLRGEDPATCGTTAIDSVVRHVRDDQSIRLLQQQNY